MNSSITKIRLRWILLTVLLFSGIFWGSVAGRHCGSPHVPVRAASRAIGAQTLLSSAADEDRLPEPDIASTDGFEFIELPTTCPESSWALDAPVQGLLPTDFFPAPLLHRPPPVSVIA